MASGRPILVIEDDSAAITLLKHAFEKAEVPNPILTVQTGDQAMAYLGGEPPFQDRTTYPLPGILLLDLKMPGSVGLDVLQWVRKHPTLHSTIVVILTGSRNRNEIRKAYQAGANSCLIKPLSMNELIEKVRTFRDYWLQQNEPPDDPI